MSILGGVMSLLLRVFVGCCLMGGCCMMGENGVLGVGGVLCLAMSALSRFSCCICSCECGGVVENML